MTKILLVRHGETCWNIEGRIQGYSADSRLTRTGILQARALGRHLATQEVEVLYCSDLGRTRETVLPIAAATGLAATFDSGLRERNYGVWEGRTFAEIERDFPEGYEAFRSRDPDFTAPGGESAVQFRDRVLAALTRIARRAGGRRVVVVTHGGVLGVMYRHAAGLPLQAARTYSMQNASINRLRYAGNRWELESWGETAHLENAAPDGVQGGSSA